MDRAKLQSKLSEMEARLGEGTLYDLLGVSRSASDGEVKAAFHAHAKVFHVDQYPAGTLGELSDRMQRVFGELAKAHATLVSTEKRKEYDASLDLAERGVPTDVQSIFAADQAFRMGKKLVDRANYKAALPHLQKACDLNRTEPDYWAYLYWTQFGLLDTDASGKPTPRSTIESIKSQLEAVSADNERCHAAELFLGHISRAIGDTTAAMKHYKKTLQRDPGNIDASSNLRLMDRRTEKQAMGFFSRLFGKR